MPESKTPPEQARVPAPDSGVPAVAVTTPTGPGTEGTISGEIVEVEREHICLDIGGDPAKIYASELMLDIGEQPADRYALGQTFTALVFQMTPHPDSGVAQYSIRRTADYLERLATLKEGSVVIGTVVQTYDVGIEIDVNGLRGNCAGEEVGLPVGQSPHNHFKPGDTAEFFVWQIDRESHALILSLKRNQPGYLDALNRLNVGDIVTASVTNVVSGGLELDIGGIIDVVPAFELPLADGETPADRYVVGDQIEALVKWIKHSSRSVGLSLRRAAPDYEDVFSIHQVGDIVTGSVTGISPGGLFLGIGIITGFAHMIELPLADGEAPTDRYAIGDQVKALIIWINHDGQDVGLSLRRVAPDYEDALATHQVGDVVTGLVVHVSPHGLLVDMNGLIGDIAAFELPLTEDKAPTDSYVVDQQITALVWRIDQIGRRLFLSVRRLAPEFVEDLVPIGAQLDAIVQSILPGSIRVQTAHGGVLLIPDYALSLSIGGRPRFEIEQRIPVIVVAVDDEGKPATLSHRRALDNWEHETKRFMPGVLVQDAQVIPLPALPAKERHASIDLGPVTGFISEDELAREAALDLMSHLPNTPYPVVVESFNVDGGFAIVSHEKFAARWRELATQFSEGSEIEGEIRTVHHNITHIDIDSGLLATIPNDKIPMLDGEGKSIHDLVGKTIPIRIIYINEDNHHIEVEHRDHRLEMLINDPESQTLEFKPKLKGPKDGNDAREMIREVIRTIAAFLNTDGGNLIIGVADDTREIIGLEEDEGVTGDTIEKKIDIAGHILNANLESIRRKSVREDFDIRNLVTWEARIIRGKIILVITCKRGPDSGVDVRVKKTATFWAREGDSTRELTEDAEILKHLQDRDRRCEEEAE